MLGGQTKDQTQFMKLDCFTPDYLKQLELRTLRATRAFLGSRQGAHRSTKKGFGIEFSDYRPYQPGDSPRDIDWGVYARTDRIYIKRFQEEQDLQVLIAVDPSLSMAINDDKWTRSWEIACSLSYLALMAQDSVIVSSGKWFQSSKLTGPKAFRKLISNIPNTLPSESTSLVEAMRSAVHRVKFPGLAFFISDFLFPIAEAIEIINLFRARNLETVLIRTLSPQDKDPLENNDDAILIDSETGEEKQISWQKEDRENYIKNYQTHAKLLEQYCQESRIQFFEHDVSTSLSKFMLETLPKMGLLR